MNRPHTYRRRDLLGTRIFSADGVIMHSAEPDEIGKEVDDLVFNVFQSRDRSKPFRSEERGHRSFCMVEIMANEPVCHTCHDSQKDIVGVLEVCLSTAKTEQQLRADTRFHVAALPAMPWIKSTTGPLPPTKYFRVLP